ncbi:MAG: hypothetical protein VKS61_14685 [Candidatus Sericytochromatia bacterium]|nr:hypothetical protein [Candidatus Sericytochromatia bacterium]
MTTMKARVPGIMQASSSVTVTRTRRAPAGAGAGGAAGGAGGASAGGGGGLGQLQGLGRSRELGEQVCREPGRLPPLERHELRVHRREHPVQQPEQRGVRGQRACPQRGEARFHHMGDVGELLEADGGGVALEAVDLAEDLVDGLRVARVPLQQGKALAHEREFAVYLVEEEAEVVGGVHAADPVLATCGCHPLHTPRGGLLATWPPCYDARTLRRARGWR